MKCRLVMLGIVAGLLPVLSWATRCDYSSPLVVDVNGDGVELGAAGTGVYFDLYDVGSPVHIQWVRPGGNEAFLVADLNGNGIVDSGSELFGEGTTLVLENTKAGNGFLALAQYDSPALGGNDDGLITRADAIWPTLRLWTDSNADGKSTRSEMKPLASLGIVALETIPKRRQYVDPSGNLIPFYAWAIRANDKRVSMVDVFFAPL